jgi:3-(methylthio)propanoyl-CoA dehydrogenase
MSEYQAPLAQMRFTLEHLADLRDVAALPGFESASADLAESVLEEAAKFASGVLDPINELGDREGVSVKDDAVVVPKAFSDAYAAFCDGGWTAIAASPEFGGQGLPKTLAAACEEMWSSANMAFALCPELAQGAVLAIDRHGTDALRQAYLEPMIAGRWTGTMCLTEPQAGSELAALTTRAVPKGDHYLITGRKIFITWGDHPMAENIAHLVLARTPDAPQGSRGISLFVVPKYRLGTGSTTRERNDVRPVSVEHKLGIHASPTCVMAFGDHGGAEGYLIGRENEGLGSMFTMMNYMRLGVGLQAVGVSERCYQKSASYARERVQGRAPGEKGRVPIIRHPDVRRMLLTMRSLTQAARALCYYTASCLDRAAHGADAETAEGWQARADLLTPIAKAWCTEAGQEITSLGIQVHGGMGYVEETGVAQFFRDTRIASIYEGTNGIQAIDLVGRKLLRDGGASVSAMVSEMRSCDPQLANAGEEFTVVRQALSRGLDEIVQCSSHLLTGDKRDPDLAGAGAMHYLMLMGTVIGGWQLARGALAALAAKPAGSADAGFLKLQVVLARFYAEQILPRALVHGGAVRAGSTTLMALPAEQF